MLTEVEGEKWFSRRSELIAGHRDDLIGEYQGIPCIRIEVQLLYKANSNRRPKDDLDFNFCLPSLSLEAKKWLSAGLETLYPEGHPWMKALAL